jgi:hypothetical protein
MLTHAGAACYAECFVVGVAIADGSFEIHRHRAGVDRIVIFYTSANVYMIVKYMGGIQLEICAVVSSKSRGRRSNVRA